MLVFECGVRSQGRDLPVDQLRSLRMLNELDVLAVLQGEGSFGLGCFARSSTATKETFKDRGGVVQLLKDLLTPVPEQFDPFGFAIE
jgi:hypothetical protein